MSKNVSFELMHKKALHCAFALMMACAAGAALAGCSSETSSSETADPKNAEVAESIEGATEQEAAPEETTEAAPEAAEFEPFVMFDQDGVVITAESEYEGLWGYGYNLLIENNTEYDLDITIDNVSIDGTMVDIYVNEVITAGMKAKVTGEDGLPFCTDDISSIEEMANVQGQVHAYDNNEYFDVTEGTIVF